MFTIFAFVWTPSVMIPACPPVSDTAFFPSPSMAMAMSAMVVCSPVERSTSISRSEGFCETCRARLMRLSVTPLIAETTTTTRCPASCVATTRRATLRMRCGLPTDVPPYFWTMRLIWKGGA